MAPANILSSEPIPNAQSQQPTYVQENRYNAFAPFPLCTFSLLPQLLLDLIVELTPLETFG